jgi:hypothetical protein
MIRRAGRSMLEKDVGQVVSLRAEVRGELAESRIRQKCMVLELEPVGD